MGNNFGTVGWAGGDEESVVALLRNTVEHGAETKTPDGTTYWLWTDSSGAGLAAFGRGDPLTIPCAKPYFWSPDAPRFTGRFVGVDQNPDICWYCSTVTVEPLDCDGMPLLFEVIRPAEIHASYDAVAAGTVDLVVSVIAFARSFDTWPDETTFYEATKRPDGAPGFSARSLIPSGAFGDSPTAHALIKGEVLASAWLTNGVTGDRFARLTVATYGVTLDVAVAAELVGDVLPGRGAIVDVNAWMVGHIHQAAAPGSTTAAAEPASAEPRPLQTSDIPHSQNIGFQSMSAAGGGRSTNWVATPMSVTELLPVLSAIAGPPATSEGEATWSQRDVRNGWVSSSGAVVIPWPSPPGPYNPRRFDTTRVPPGTRAVVEFFTISVPHQP